MRGETEGGFYALSMLPAAQPVAIAATSDIPQADAPIAAAKADRMVIASLIQKLRLKLFLFIVVLFIRQNDRMTFFSENENEYEYEVRAVD